MGLTDRAFLSASGRIAWVHRERCQGRCTNDPTPVGCVCGARTGHDLGGGYRRLSLPPSPIPWIGTNDVGSMDVSAPGRFLVADVQLSVYTFIDKQGLTGVLDRATDSTENLWTSPCHPPTRRRTASPAA